VASIVNATAALKKWRGYGMGLETHVSLPLFALLLLGAIWAATNHFIEIERATARQATIESLGELIDTYEAQMARSLGAIDQTLKAVKYAVEQQGPKTALSALGEHGLLPSGLVFVVSIADSDGAIVASNPQAAPARIHTQRYFTIHREGDNDFPYVSQTLLDAKTTEGRINFSRRLNDAQGRFAGVVVVEVSPAYFTSGYERSRLGDWGILGLVGSDTKVRAMRIGDKLSWGQKTPAILEMDTTAAGVKAWDDVQRSIAVRRLHGFPLSAVVGLAEREQMAPFEQHRSSYMWEAGIASLVLVLSVALVSRWSWKLTQSQRRIRRAQETYAAASEASLDAFFVLRAERDANGKVVDFSIDATNSRAERMTGMSKEVLHSTTLCTLLPEWRINGIFNQLVRITEDGGVHEEEWENRAVAIQSNWLHRQVVGVEGGVVAIIRDITARKLAEERVRFMAHHDGLTGLPNRSLIDDRLNQSILHAERNVDNFAVAFIDLDGFKMVNDGLGHNAGDELLKLVGERMVNCVRRSDTVGRFGGDEFVIILNSPNDDASTITPVLEKIRAAVTQSIVLGGQSVQVSCSIGVALYPQDGSTPRELLLNADAAMYRAKQMGANNFQFYAPEMNASVEAKLMLLDGLRHALEDGQFRVLYQPKIDVRTGLIFGVEALIRWQHPEHGMISPLRFIPLAEETGMIVSIGAWVLETACKQSMAWQAAGLAPITISVNVSARQFEENQLIERVALAMQESGLAPEHLELEVTESLIMRDLQQSIDKMRQLNAMGVSLSIDDFGTGYSSLSALKSFPISRLKIDKSFVSDLADNPDDQAIALAVISLAHKLDLRVIAEGVETEDQLRFLRENECDEMQGYLFSPPVPANDIRTLLVKQAYRQFQTAHDVHAGAGI
jgi:diguanylate cyclase (GGDEF)-like protein/PAS domain S-box-containing protein